MNETARTLPFKDSLETVFPAEFKSSNSGARRILASGLSPPGVKSEIQISAASATTIEPQFSSMSWPRAGPVENFVRST